MFEWDRYLNYRPLLFPFFLPSWEIRNYLLVQTISSTIFKNNLFASKKHRCIKLSKKKHNVKIRIFSKRRRHVFRWNNWPQFDRVIRAPHFGCARIFDPVPPTRPGIITREPRYRLPNSRVNLRRDEGGRERERSTAASYLIFAIRECLPTIRGLFRMRPWLRR